MEYRKFTLTPGQQSPKGSTSQGMIDGSIVWIGEEGTFPEVATTNPQVPGASNTYINHVMNQDEIDEYDYILANPSEPEG